MEIWFVSDTHFGHQKIIEHCKRPFSTVQEMDDAMIERWNSVVKPGDTVYHLGDVTFRGGKGAFNAIFPRLHGVKHLIIGNHDNDEVLAQAWASQSLIRDIKINGQKIVLSHYPMRSWNGMYRGSMHLFGHEHGQILNYSNCCDVGADAWDFYPVTFEQIQARISTLVPWVAKP